MLAGCALILLAPIIAGAQPDGAVHEFLTVEEALHEVFPQSANYVQDEITLDADALYRVEEALHRKLDGSTYGVTLCYDSAGRFLGYAMISDEIGKYRPITYIVGVDPDFTVRKVAVMVYREDRGGEVKTPRFLYQFRGKSADDPIRVNRDIVNISGATISVRAISSGVKKVLLLVDDHYRTHPPAAMLSTASGLERTEQ